MSPDISWPPAELTPLVRARALAAAIPSAASAEVTLAAPFADCWRFIADLPHSVPAFDGDVSSLRIRTRVEIGDGVEQLTATVHNHGVPWPFSVRLESGFCLMQARARLYTVVMAAAPEPGDPTRTRFLHVEAVPLLGGRLVRSVIERLVAHDMANLARLAQRGFRT